MEEMDETEVDAQVDLDYFLFHSHLRFLISIWLPRKYERAKSFHDHLICNRFEGKNEKDKKTQRSRTVPEGSLYIYRRRNTGVSHDSLFLSPFFFFVNCKTHFDELKNKIAVY